MILISAIEIPHQHDAKNIAQIQNPLYRKRSMDFCTKETKKRPLAVSPESPALTPLPFLAVLKVSNKDGLLPTPQSRVVQANVTPMGP